VSTQEKTPTLRLDKWLWAVRLYKTRTLATEACKKGAIKVENKSAKPSKEIKVGDKITLKMGPLHKEVQVEGLPQRRLSAVLASDLVTDLTSPEEYEKAKEQKYFISLPAKNRKVAGRPTKKQRRALDEFLYPES
jgi:ribosome-associated heat shock protein Hsp15